MGRKGDDFKYYLVGWRRVCEPIQIGGLIRFYSIRIYFRNGRGGTRWRGMLCGEG